MKEVWINDVKDSVIDPADRALAYGDGLFATMKVKQGQIQFLEQHLRRLSDGAARLGFAFSVGEALLFRLNELATLNPDACVKLLLSRGSGGRGYTAPKSPVPLVILSVSPLPAHYVQWQQRGIGLCKSSVALGRQPLLAGVKHLNRLEQVLIKAQSLPQGIDDVWVCDSDGLLIEGSMGNLLLISGNQVLTPALSFAGVSGVMREQVIHSLLAMGLNVTMGQVTESELLQAEHVLMTNSLMGAVPVTCLEDRALTTWSRLSELQQLI